MARGPSQGEALGTWAVWAAITAVVLVTYSWVDPAETYHVSREGLAGGLSRGLTLVNFPIALVAIALVLVAMAVLPAAAWWAAGPAIALVRHDSVVRRAGQSRCALGERDPRARSRHRVRADGRRHASRGASARPAATLGQLRAWSSPSSSLAVSLPWICAELGFHFPGDFFMGEELGREKDGTLIAAVHLGHHHGQDGALLLLTALLLSRVFVRERAACGSRSSRTSGRCSRTAPSTSSRTPGTSRS